MAHVSPNGGDFGDSPDLIPFYLVLFSSGRILDSKLTNLNLYFFFNFSLTQIILHDLYIFYKNKKSCIFLLMFFFLIVESFSQCNLS